MSNGLFWSKDTDLSIDQYRTIRGHLEAALNVLESHRHSGYFANDQEYIKVFSTKDQELLESIIIGLQVTNQAINKLNYDILSSVTMEDEDD